MGLNLDAISFTIDPGEPNTVIFQIQVSDDQNYLVRVPFDTAKRTSVYLTAVLEMIAEGSEAAKKELDGQSKLLVLAKPKIITLPNSSARN